MSSVELLMNNHQGIKAEIDARNDSFTTCIELGKSLLARKHYASEEVCAALLRGPGAQECSWCSDVECLSRMCMYVLYVCMCMHIYLHTERNLCLHSYIHKHMFICISKLLASFLCVTIRHLGKTVGLKPISLWPRRQFSRTMAEGLFSLTSSIGPLRG